MFVERVTAKIKNGGGDGKGGKSLSRWIFGMVMAFVKGDHDIDLWWG